MLHTPPHGLQHIALRRAWLGSMRWQRHIFFLLGGIAVGVAAVIMAKTADWVGGWFRGAIQGHMTVTLLLTPLGFAAISWIARRYFPNSGGSGIPQAIAARNLTDQGARQRLVGLRMAIGKMVMLLCGLLCGASIGREGPTVQVGAAIMFALGRLSPRRQPQLILAGAGAGVAAAFNTPLGGVIFAIEEMSRSFDPRTSGLIVWTVIAAGLTALAIEGDYTYFGVVGAHMLGWQSWLAVPLLGVLGGLAGGVFSRILVEFGRGLPGAHGRAIKANPTWFAAACGFAVALCGVASNGDAFGTGYEQARAMVDGHGQAPNNWYALLKMIATTASSISGIPGGLFAPSLSVGAGLGANMALVLPDAPIAALIVIGMVAYFSGVVQAPITAFAIVAEMTNDHAMILPLMIASLIGTFTSRLICHEGVYHALARNYFTAESSRAGSAAGIGECKGAQ